MTNNIVDLTERRNAAERPDPEFIRKDDFGREMQCYCLSYTYDGKTWGGLDLWAYSMEDAEGRVAAIRESLIMMGQIFTVIPG